MKQGRIELFEKIFDRIKEEEVAAANNVDVLKR